MPPSVLSYCLVCASCCNCRIVYRNNLRPRMVSSSWEGFTCAFSGPLRAVATWDHLRPISETAVLWSWTTCPSRACRLLGHSYFGDVKLRVSTLSKPLLPNVGEGPILNSPQLYPISLLQFFYPFTSQPLSLQSVSLLVEKGPQNKGGGGGRGKERRNGKEKVYDTNFDYWGSTGYLKNNSAREPESEKNCKKVCEYKRWFGVCLEVH